MKATFFILFVLFPTLSFAGTLDPKQDPALIEDPSSEGRAPFVLSTDCKAMGCATRPKSIFSNVESGASSTAKDKGAVH